MKKFFNFLLALAIVPAFIACDDDNKSVSVNNSLEACRFINNVMYTYYYWNREMPDIDYRTQNDPEKYFYSLLSDEDLFSYITDDREGYLKMFEGTSTTKGWSYNFMYLDETRVNICAQIEFVYDGSPAQKAGAKRGDIVIKVNDQSMTVNNYSEVFGATSAKCLAMRYNPVTDSYTQVTYNITALEATLSPVARHNVFDVDGAKIGYLLYMDFYEDFNDELTQVFAEFKEKGVNELILDFRYNTGGEMTAMEHLCSLVAPQKNVANGDMLVYYRYNSILSRAEGFTKEESAAYFIKALAPNTLDLGRVVVLTGNNTYSASEATVIALQPYMEVTMIGDVTGGKNSTMFVMYPSLFTNATGQRVYDQSIDNWLMMPIVAKYFNSNNETFDTSNKRGMAPHFAVDENSMPYGELGDKDELLTAAAIEYLTTGTVTDKSSNKSLRVNKVFARPAKPTSGAIVGNFKATEF